MSPVGPSLPPTTMRAAMPAGPSASSEPTRLGASCSRPRPSGLMARDAERLIHLAPGSEPLLFFGGQRRRGRRGVGLARPRQARKQRRRARPEIAGFARDLHECGLAAKRHRRSRRPDSWVRPPLAGMPAPNLDRRAHRLGLAHRCPRLVPPRRRDLGLHGRHGRLPRGGAPTRRPACRADRCQSGRSLCGQKREHVLHRTVLRGAHDRGGGHGDGFRELRCLRG